MFDNGKDVRNQPNFGSVCHQESRWEVLSIASVSIRKYGTLNAPIRGFLSTEQSTGCARFVPTKLGNGLTLNEPAGEASAPPDAHVALLSVGSIWPPWGIGVRTRVTIVFDHAAFFEPCVPRAPTELVAPNPAPLILATLV